MSDKMQSEPETAEFLLYQTEDGQTQLEVAFRGETCWLSLNQLAELFQRDKSVISRHIKNIFDEGELVHEATVAKFATVQIEGAKTVQRQIEFYNLDMLNRIVNAYLEFAELQALNRKPMYMQDWIDRLDDFSN